MKYPYPPWAGIVFVNAQDKNKYKALQIDSLLFERNLSIYLHSSEYLSIFNTSNFLQVTLEIFLATCDVPFVQV